MAAGLVPLVCYAMTLARTITWRNGGIDSGDAATGAAVLGVLHPPGYALYVTVAHLTVRLLPWVEPAGAVAWLGALGGTAAAVVVYWSARVILADGWAQATVADAAGGEVVAPLQPRAGGGDSVRLDVMAAVAAAWAVALGPLWWRQSNLPTVHAFNLLFAAILGAIVARVTTRGWFRRWAVAGALVTALAATHHLTLLAIPLALAVALIGFDRGALRALRGAVDRVLIARLVAALMVGILPWVGLIVLAARRPVHLWGDPSSVGGFIDVVLAQQYQEYLAYPTALGTVYRAALGFWTIAREMGVIGFPAAMAGLALTWERRRVYGAFVLALAAVLVAFFARYAARDVESYLLPVAVAAAPMAAVGVRALFGMGTIQRWPLRATGVAILGLVLVAGTGIGLSYRDMDLHSDRAALDYARGVLAEAPPNALIVSETDLATFSLWYVRLALGERPDTAVVDRWMVAWPWYRAHVERVYSDIRMPDAVLSGRALASGQVTARPVVVTNADANWDVPIERGRLVHRIAPSAG
ncbi:MAG: DUF2723 domain-containing protein [Chloroflexota bacterium]|nr:MAG: DUF2723 domain-containing protein [Chloroflexota bacterium]